tara:strand:+ start:9878 stop:11113 length:1236 start_codon:yes stop_codon:yes gene_type:complete
MKNNNLFELPLMDDNITREDVNEVIDFLSQDPIPRLTNGPKVKEFEEEWSKWLGVEYSLMVNSGSAANELTMLALKYIEDRKKLGGTGEIIIPPLTWISDVASVLFSGFTPIFCDVNMKNLSFDLEKLKECITKQTKAIFVTHVLGINALSDELIEICEQNNILLIEDVCESHGATFKNRKVGSIGFASNFSFYFAHHMSTIEGGMVCTNDEEFYQVCRMLRSHGMSREATDENLKNRLIDENPDLNPDFIFARPSHNFRSTEINAVMALSQIKRLDQNNEIRKQNFSFFVNSLDPDLYVTDLETEGQCNYALIVIMKGISSFDYFPRPGSMERRDAIEKALKDNNIEFRRGLSGGGNQMLQPYMKSNFPSDPSNFNNINYLHNFSWYIGNYPTLHRNKIEKLIDVLNNET